MRYSQRRRRWRSASEANEPSYLELPPPNNFLACWFLIAPSVSFFGNELPESCEQAYIGATNARKRDTRLSRNGGAAGRHQLRGDRGDELLAADERRGAYVQEFAVAFYPRLATPACRMSALRWASTRIASTHMRPGARAVVLVEDAPRRRRVCGPPNGVRPPFTRRLGARLQQSRSSLSRRLADAVREARAAARKGDPAAAASAVDRSIHAAIEATTGLRSRGVLRPQLLEHRCERVRFDPDAAAGVARELVDEGVALVSRLSRQRGQARA